MPKIITEENKQNIKNLMYQRCIILIREKGIRKVTVEDITQSMGFAKGSFYQYYDSKEVFLYDVLKRNEKESFEKMLSMKLSKEDIRGQLISVFNYIFMSENCLFLDTKPSDLEYLLSRLPAQIREKEQEKSSNNFNNITALLDMKNTRENYGTLSYLMDGLQAIGKSSFQYGEEGRKRAMKIIINSIADFILEERNDK